jgi:hypothetical protein
VAEIELVTDDPGTTERSPECETEKPKSWLLDIEDVDEEVEARLDKEYERSPNSCWKVAWTSLVVKGLL